MSKHQETFADDDNSHQEHASSSVQQLAVDSHDDISHVDGPPKVALAHVSTSSKRKDNDHRIKFNLAAFGTTFENGSMATKRPKNSRILTKQEYNNWINVFRYWNVKEGHTDPRTGRPLSQLEFRRLHSKKWYRLAKIYQVATSTSDDGTVVEQLKRYDSKKGDWKLVVHEENAFDALAECHGAVGHKKINSTRKEAAQKYFNLTEELCKIFVSYCPKCCEKLSQQSGPRGDEQSKDRENVCNNSCSCCRKKIICMYCGSCIRNGDGADDGVI